METDECSDATVTAVEERGLARVLLRSENCEGCAGKGACGLRSADVAETELLVVNHASARVGQRVHIRTSGRDRAKTTCLIYLLPSISILFGVMAGQAILGNLLGLSEVLAGLLGALLMLGPGLVPAWIAGRKGLFMPEIEGLVEENSGDY